MARQAHPKTGSANGIGMIQWMVTPSLPAQAPPEFGALLGQGEADDGPLILPNAAEGPEEQPWPFLLTITRS